MPYTNKQIILDSYTAGLPEESNFRLANTAISACKPEHLIVQNHYLSADPAQKGWMGTVANYMRAKLGEPMRGSAVGEIVESRIPGYEVGEFIAGPFGWQEYSHIKANVITRKVDPAIAPVQTSLGVLGITGLTAYIALHSVLQPRTGETLLVTSAAGAVGSIVGQLAKTMGCQVVGLTGSDEKVKLCLEEFGYDAALNYRTDNLADALVQTCPDGIDMFYDMAAGELADAVFPQMNNRGRIAQIGTAAVASWDPAPLAPRRERLILTKELKQQGFIVANHGDQFEEALSRLTSLIQSGELNYREHIFEDLEAAPRALVSLYGGTNRGKALVRLV